MRIRVVKTNSNAKAVQVVSYQNNKRVIHKHIGSAHTDEALKELMMLANEWIKDYTGQLSIFSDSNPNSVLHTNHSSFIGVKYHLFYKQIRTIQRQIGLDGLPALLNDLVAIRIFEPASKLRSLALLEQYLNRSLYGLVGELYLWAFSPWCESGLDGRNRLELYFTRSALLKVFDWFSCSG